MKKQNVTAEDVELFEGSGINPETKEITAANINKGRSLEDAFAGPHGRVLTEQIDAVLIESLGKIMRFKHDPDKSTEQNYSNILALILEHESATKFKAKCETILRTKESSLNRIKHISNKIKQGRNGG